VFSTALVTVVPHVARAQAIEAWVQRYNGPANAGDWAWALAVDASGSVYVTGGSYGSSIASPDCVTLAYSSTGLPLWTNRYNGPGNSSDQAFALALDANGNVVVTGFSFGSAGPDCVTIKYSSAGVPLWTNRYNGPANGSDQAVALAMDSSGNVVVTGYAYNGSNDDYLTIQYSSAGVLLWVRSYNGPANGDDSAHAVAVDATGKVFVTGTSDGVGTGSDYATVAYSIAGVPLWTNRYDGGYIGPYGPGGDRANALALEASGDVFVTGASDGHGYATIRYSGAGVPVWTNCYNGQEATAVAVDPTGNVVVTGSAFHGSGTGNDFATLKYSGAGVPLWTNLYNGPGNGTDWATALAVNASGSVFVTGWSAGIGDNPDYATVAYSGAGVSLWTNRYDGPGRNWDVPRAVALDASGNVYVAGGSKDVDFDDDLATIKYVTPPIITRQPLSCTNTVGTTASFSVEAVGGLPLSYQWRKGDADLADGGNIAGVTTTNLLIANVQLTDAGGYSVVVTNAYGTTTSAVAQLTVIVPPSGGQLTNVSYSPETGFSFIFRDGTVGQTYRIQRSLSLAEGSWVDWQTFTYHEPLGLMDVGAAGAEWRFYRAISP